jgi:serine/threonine protein kinase/Tol biopolymer transport system component
VPLSSGTKLGPYEIVSALGAGGMGEVYRARDSRLDRTVAIKVLPSHHSTDSALRQRFEREARTISQFSHPNICTLHDIGTHDGLDYLVMEYIEGETLEQRLSKAPIPPTQALAYGIQVADALDKAHRAGIIHRDLKPANVMLTKSGAKLLDFGLAKLQEEVSVMAAALTEMTVETKRLTTEGTLVGTFQYMAPEQLEGRQPDARSDIFAFGAVLYEMLSGKPAFGGKTKASMIAAILSSEPPPLSTVQPLAPPALERVIQQCLAKDPDERWQSAGDIARELKWIAEGGSQASEPVPAISRRSRREYMAWGLAAVGFVLAIVFGSLFAVRTPKPQSAIRSLILQEENTTPLLIQDNAGPVVLAPDGKALAYVAIDTQGRILLWLRKLSEVHARALPGTDGANFPFWSADSHAIGFFSGGKLKTVTLDGGSPSIVCDAPLGRGGSWNSDGTILFAPTFESGLYQVPSSGGTPRAVTKLDKSKHDSHRWPLFLPDGKHFLYLAITHNSPRDPNNGIYFASLDGKENRLVMQSDTQADYSAGYLLFARDTSLMAQPFNSRTGVLEGAPAPVADQVLVDPGTWRLAASGTEGGLLAYVSGGAAANQLTWYDLSGKATGLAGKILNLNHVRISPDGLKIAADLGESLSDIWLYDLKRGVSTRFTFGPSSSVSPVWSPDGKWIAYGTLEHGDMNIYRKPAGGMGQAELLLESTEGGMQNWPTDWSPDGKTLLYTVGDLVGAAQLWELPLSGDTRKPKRLMPTGFMMMEARYSPDGRWIAYASNESGRFEIYVIPASGSGGKWQISSSGGQQPLWRRDGKELFFLSNDDNLMSVPIKLNPDSVQADAAHPLFPLANAILSVNGLVAPYDVTADGKRFIVVTVEQGKSFPINLVTNWTAVLQK